MSNMMIILFLTCGFVFGMTLMAKIGYSKYAIGKRFLNFVNNDKKGGLLVFDRGTIFIGVKHVILGIGDEVVNPYNDKKGKITGMHILFNKKIKATKVTPKEDDANGLQPLSNEDFQQNEGSPDVLITNEGFTKLQGSWTIRYDIVYEDNSADVLEDSDILKYMVSNAKLESYIKKHEKYLSELRNIKSSDDFKDCLDNDDIGGIIKNLFK